MITRKFPKVAVNDLQLVPRQQRANMATPIQQSVTSKQEEIQMPNAESTKKTTLSRTQKISMLREYAISRMSREEICKKMNLSDASFTGLYFDLSQMDKVMYDIPHKPKIRKWAVGKNGILITEDKLIAAGLEKIFTQGKPLALSKEENRLIIEVDEEADELESENDEEMSSVAPDAMLDFEIEEAE